MIEVPYRVRPVGRWPKAPTPDHLRGYSPFRSDLSATLRLLEKELRHLDADSERVFLQCAVRDRDIRLTLKANARQPDHPGVILTFELNGIVRNLPCDTYRDWRDNLRAIALSLKALRAVDRYGVTTSGEQYEGFGRIGPGGSSAVAQMSPRVAAEIMVDAEERDGDAETLLVDYDAVRWTYQNAAKRVHPDRHGGDTERFQVLTAAKKVLDDHHRVSR